MTTLPLANRKFQANKTRARPLGSGELARTRELRKRGIHLQLTEAWRLFPPNSKLKVR